MPCCGAGYVLCGIQRLQVMIWAGLGMCWDYGGVVQVCGVELFVNTCGAVGGVQGCVELVFWVVQSGVLDLVVCAELAQSRGVKVQDATSIQSQSKTLWYLTRFFTF
ncbi:hypothetical protein U1Q18_018946 [Sarracenia purpurea var. burkii]